MVYFVARTALYVSQMSKMWTARLMHTNLITNAALIHPLANPLLGLLALVIVGCVNEVTALLVKEVEHLLGLCLVTGPHVILYGGQSLACGAKKVCRVTSQVVC